MAKSNLRNEPVITIHINTKHKDALYKKAERLGLPLATYCRMILLQSLGDDAPDIRETS